MFRHLQGGEDVADHRVTRQAAQAATRQRAHAERVEAPGAATAVWPAAQQRQEHLFDLGKYAWNEHVCEQTLEGNKRYSDVGGSMLPRKVSTQ